MLSLFGIDVFLLGNNFMPLIDLEKKYIAIVVSGIVSVHGFFWWRKIKNDTVVASKIINNIEGEIREKYGLEYCQCQLYDHFYSPNELKLWNTKNNIFFDSHQKERNVPELRPSTPNKSLKDRDALKRAP